MKLVKTGQEIYRALDKKYLVLPQGLDELEEMLRKEMVENYVVQPDVSLNNISTVFSKFKKEQGI
jgi:hypothetical protein